MPQSGSSAFPNNQKNERWGNNEKKVTYDTTDTQTKTNCNRESVLEAARHFRVNCKGTIEQIFHWIGFDILCLDWHFKMIACLTNQDAFKTYCTNFDSMNKQKLLETALHVCTYLKIKWTTASGNITSDMCAKWRFRSDCAFADNVGKDAKFLHADNEDSYQTARKRRLIWVFDRCTCKKVRFLTLRFKYFS